MVKIARWRTTPSWPVSTLTVDVWNENFFYLAFALLRFTQLPNGNKWEKLPVLRRRLHLRYGSSNVCLLALAFGSLM